jgi:hypothetical protein
MMITWIGHDPGKKPVQVLTGIVHSRRKKPQDNKKHVEV